MSFPHVYYDASLCSQPQMAYPPPPPQPQLQAPPQPQLHVTNGGTAITIQWQSVGPLASSYVLEVRDSTSSASNFFTRLAPADSADSLELCLQGLEPGRGYIACVKSVAQGGTESLPSAWSPWLTLPVVIQSNELLPSAGNVPASYMLPFTPQPADHIIQKTYELPLHKAYHPQDLIIQSPYEMLMGDFGSQPPPEVTGQEEMMLFLD